MQNAYNVQEFGATIRRFLPGIGGRIQTLTFLQAAMYVKEMRRMQAAHGVILKHVGITEKEFMKVVDQKLSSETMKIGLSSFLANTPAQRLEQYDSLIKIAAYSHFFVTLLEAQPEGLARTIVQGMPLGPNTYAAWNQMLESRGLEKEAESLASSCFAFGKAMRTAGEKLDPTFFSEMTMGNPKALKGAEAWLLKIITPAYYDLLSFALYYESILAVDPNVSKTSPTFKSTIPMIRLNAENLVTATVNFLFTWRMGLSLIGRKVEDFSLFDEECLRCWLELRPKDSLYTFHDTVEVTKQILPWLMNSVGTFGEQITKEAA